MNIALTPENAAAVAKYAELTGHTPDEFLNHYLTDNVVPLFENIRSGELESHLALAMTLNVLSPGWKKG